MKSTQSNNDSKALSHTFGKAPDPAKAVKMEKLTRHERFRRDRIALILATIRAIVASGYCREYLIGYTSISYWTRYRDHRSYGYKYFAIVADRMRFDDALDLEMALQRGIKSGSKRSVLYRKYEPKARADYSRRSGHKAGDNMQNCHAVYIVWR